MTVFMFLLLVAILVVTWNHHFVRVPLRFVAIMLFCVLLHQHETLFSARANLPGALAYAAQPWKSLDRPPANANTGIIFTQIAPWTKVARRCIRQGEAPLWNRYSASGAPLMANQQTAILHPVTIATMALPPAKGFSLSAALRLFISLFFLYIFLRNWSIRPLAALFGSVAYAFSTFSIVWLLFPLGLATLGVVPGLAIVDEFFRRPTRASFVALVVTLALPILGGHPESAFWVGVTLAAYGIYIWRSIVTIEQRRPVILRALAAGLLAVAITAVWWLPTLEALPHTTRYSIMKDFGHPTGTLPSAWATTLLAPNVLGTPQARTYNPPTPAVPTLLDDYGEIASGYAGILTIALAISTLGRRYGAVRFFSGTAIFAFLTVTHAPVFYPLLRSLPIVDLTLDQRLRFLWALSIAILAAFSLDRFSKDVISRRFIVLSVTALGICAAVAYSSSPRGWEPAASIAVVVCVVAVASLFAFQHRHSIAVLIALTFIELALVTWRYNPSATSDDIYPSTGAIIAMQQQPRPFRIAALGWSFLPETPAWWGLEDVKTTDPMSNARYMRLMLGYLHVWPGSYDQVIGNTEEPFLDFLNVRYLYVPPDHAVPDDFRLRTIYRGRDGVVAENLDALPRYFFVRDFVYEPSFDVTVARLKEIRNFGASAVVDSVAAAFGGVVAGSRIGMQGGTVELREYGERSATLYVRSQGWNLLASSDVAWPGWTARFNNRRLPIVRVNGAFVGVFVPPGEGTVQLAYTPRGYIAGLIISLLTLPALIWMRARAFPQTMRAQGAG